jgi:hypothetical protein
MNNEALYVRKITAVAQAEYKLRTYYNVWYGVHASSGLDGPLEEPLGKSRVSAA